MTETRKLRVFLCHSSQDKPIVRELYQRLNAEGWIDPWLDEEKLLPGQDWDMEIEKAVEAADAVVLCLSNNSVTKEGYVQKEIKVALNFALFKPEGVFFIIPLRLDNCLVPNSLRSIQYVDYFPEIYKNQAYVLLMKSLKSKRGYSHEVPQGLRSRGSLRKPINMLKKMTAWLFEKEPTLPFDKGKHLFFLLLVSYIISLIIGVVVGLFMPRALSDINFPALFLWFFGLIYFCGFFAGWIALFITKEAGIKFGQIFGVAAGFGVLAASFNYPLETISYTYVCMPIMIMPPAWLGGYSIGYIYSMFESKSNL